MGDSKRTIYTATLQEREAVCAEAYDLRVKAALRFCAGVPIPEGGPTLAEVLKQMAAWEDMIVNCAGVPQNPDSLPQMLRHDIRQLLAHFSRERAMVERENRLEDALRKCQRALAMLIWPRDSLGSTVINAWAQCVEAEAAARAALAESEK